MATTSANMERSSSLRFGSTRRWRRISELSLGYALLAPAVILLLVFEIYPLFYGLFISMCNWRINCGDNLERFVWFDNYTRAFTDPEFYNALSVTVTYVVLSVPLQLGLALVIAYGLWSLSRWGFYLTLAYLVYFGIVSIVLSGLNSALTYAETVQVYFGNFLWSALIVTYLIWTRKRFFPGR